MLQQSHLATTQHAACERGPPPWRLSFWGPTSRFTQDFKGDVHQSASHPCTCDESLRVKPSLYQQWSKQKYGIMVRLNSFNRSKEKDSLKISTPVPISRSSRKNTCWDDEPDDQRGDLPPILVILPPVLPPIPFLQQTHPYVSWRRQNAFKMRNLNLRLPSLPPQLSNASSPDKRFQRQAHVLRRLLDKDRVCWVFLTFLLILNSSSSCPLPHSHHLLLSPVLSPAA